MDNIGEITKQFMKIFSQAVAKKMYGSIEVYFEAGKVTQVTQRIINKIHKKDKIASKPNGHGRDHGDVEGRNTLLTS